MPYLILFIATILGANWAIQVFGLVPVGPNLLAPAGVYFAGLAFTFRDLAQEKVSRGWIVAAIAAGAVLSAAVSTKFAVASGIAFLISELLDFAVYTPLRRRNWIGAVVASNVVGLIADSVLFLVLAFGSLQYLSGQVIGKAWMTLLAVAVLWLLRRRMAPGENGGDAAPAASTEPLRRPCRAASDRSCFPAASIPPRSPAWRARKPTSCSR